MSARGMTRFDPNWATSFPKYLSLDHLYWGSRCSPGSGWSVDCRCARSATRWRALREGVDRVLCGPDRGAIAAACHVQADARQFDSLSDPACVRFIQQHSHSAEVSMTIEHALRKW